MPVKKREFFQIVAEEDIVKARKAVREAAVAGGCRLVDQTKLVTAASEIARNVLQYGRGGTMLLERLEEHGREGVRLVFDDQGPGIPDVELALKDGFTSGCGLGLGLGGAKRLGACRTFTRQAAGC